MEVPKTSSKHQILQSIGEQILAALVPQITGWRKVPKSLSDQILQSAREQSLDVPVPRMIEQLVDVPKIIFQGRVQQWTFEQFADTPVLQVVEEPVFSQERVQQRLVEKIHDSRHSCRFTSREVC